ncbi:hypothetical protein EMCRGX_G028235 [Ephydatia muelleri]
MFKEARMTTLRMQGDCRGRGLGINCDASSSRGLLHDIRRRAAAEGPVFTGCLSPNPSTRPPFVREDATCCSSCAGGYLTASFNVCYACGIDYCTLCQQVDGVSQCLQCRDPLVVSVNKSLCLTTAEYQSDPCLVQNELFRLEELAIEQRAEEAAEVRSQAIIKDRCTQPMDTNDNTRHCETYYYKKGLRLREKGWG